MANEAPRRQIDATLMFADICESTRLYERLGDDVAQQTIRGALAAIRRLVEDNHGEVIKEIGDEIMAAFDNPQDAVDCATRLSGETDRFQLQLKTGIHSGNVINEQGDLFGDAVNTAARIVALASPGQILLSATTGNGLSPSTHSRLRSLPPLSLKGKSDRIELFEYLFDDDLGLTQVMSGEALQALLSDSAAPLQLNWSTGSVTLADQSDSITIGRDPRHPVCLPSPMVSRNHVRIERDGTNWYLTDQSTNGTLLSEQGTEPVLLRRERRPLKAAGTFNLAPAHKNNPDTIIEYLIGHTG